MNVSVVIPTRGDVSMLPVIASFPKEWEIVIYDNGHGEVRILPAGDDSPRLVKDVPDLSVYARYYAAIEYASHDLILTQDDDVIVSDPEAIVDTFLATRECSEHGPMARQVAPTSGIAVWACDEHDPKPCVLDAIVANMPREFRHDGYTDSCLVGFGACFHRDAPVRAFDRYAKVVAGGWCPPYPTMWGKTSLPNPTNDQSFLRTCDVVFTTLTPRVLVDVAKTDREMASDPTRMWKQPGHLGERTRMLELARKVRDA